MIAAACVLFLMVLIIRLTVRYFRFLSCTAGLMSSDNPEQFFANFSKITFKNAFNELVTLFGDIILISSASFSLIDRELNLSVIRSTDATSYGSEPT
ncbi:hypothetical protein AZE42_08160 [Rhizopogon vesiculosus]|uniref:Uncharacterized protein n=1 Tax=Rhizopogon vesiculosus TaxID=180088 RepID=A0A1J8REH4_9AGAM|nr:hypothetical protein AZE42_08160 [Rhizopogon vesiculosus]